MTIKYCHECAEFALKYEIRKTGHSPAIASDPASRTFTLTDKQHTVVVSVEEMTVQQKSTIHCKDWKILIGQILHFLYN